MPIFQNVVASPGFSANGIVITGEQPRILGDFSNTTIANRVAFQTNTVNGVTGVIAIPNGTGTSSSYHVYNNSDPTNASVGNFAIVGSTDMRIQSFITGTGTYLPMTFYTGGSERMRIDSSGNVGIGTTIPNRALVVNSAIKSQGWGGANNGNIFFGADERVSIFGGADVLVSYTASAERMRIDGSGNVGIGTSSPAKKLHAQISFEDGLRIDSGDPNKLFDISYDTVNNIIKLGSVFSSGYGVTPLTFWTNQTERMRIDSSGNVGIGTSSPGGKLDVAGFAIFGNYGGTYQGITLQNNDNSASAETISFIDSRNNLGTIDTSVFFIHQTDGGSYIKFDTTPAGSRSYDRRTERMRISSAGEVWIAGTTDRGAYNLQCNGTGVWGAGAYTNGSDARIKDNITPLDSGLDVVEKLNPVTFKYKEDWSKDQSVQTGFIAQELLVALEGKDYVDGIVQQGGEYMSVAYQNIIPILTKAIQELKVIVDEQAEKIKALESK